MLGPESARPGGMAMTASYISIPHFDLITVAREIHAIGTELDEHRGPRDCDGLEGSAQREVATAIEYFCDEWKQSVYTVIGEIADWGGLTLAISEIARNLDDGLAAALCSEGVAYQSACTPGQSDGTRSAAEQAVVDHIQKQFAGTPASGPKAP